MSSRNFPLRTKLRFPLLRASTLSVSWQFRLQFPFVFRRLNPCRCFHPAHPCFLLQLVTFVYRFHFWLLWAFHSTAFTPLPFSFLTSAVFAFFRPLQFWISTTQPLFLLFPFLHKLASQCSLAARFSSRIPVFPFRFSLVSHAAFRFPVLSAAVCFLLPFPASLPQPFHRCSFHLSTSGFSVPFRFLSSASDPFMATQPSVPSFPSSSRSCLTVAFPVLSSPFGSLSFPFFLPDFSCSLPVIGTWLSDGFLSSYPASLPQLFHR